MTKQITQNKKHESGRSMIEMVGVLALMGLLTAVAFLLIQSGMVSQKVARTADEINTLVGNVRGIAAEKGDFSNLPLCSNNNAKKLAAAILDPDTVNTSIKAPIGGTYAVCKETSDLTSFYVYIYSMNADDCSMMEMRSYSGGVAECSGRTLKIKYQ